MRNILHPSPPLLASAEPIDAPWSHLVPDDQLAVLVAGTNALQTAGVHALLGGAIALAAYTQRVRSTKDIDVIVRPRDAERAVGAIRSAGFDDYFGREAYDRSWIFRGFRDGVLFDVIWELPNHRVKIDEAWFDRAPPIRVHGIVYAAVPAEELIRMKLYVLQRERCDWVDVLNILAGACDTLDWQWLVRRMGTDQPLLQAMLAIFNWMCPKRARCIPGWLREQFGLPKLELGDDATELERVRLFDSRPWFAPHQPADRPLER